MTKGGEYHPPLLFSFCSQLCRHDRIYRRRHSRLHAPEAPDVLVPAVHLSVCQSVLMAVRAEIAYHALLVGRLNGVVVAPALVDVVELSRGYLAFRVEGERAL